MSLRSLVFAGGLLAALLAGCSDPQTGTPVGGDGKQAGTTTKAPTRSTPLPDVPPDQIKGIKHVEYRAGVHVAAPQRVRYQHSPPFGGAHDQYWAGCNGVVYPKAVRSENMVHSLEHGAVWIAYNPERLDQAAVSRLAAKVPGKSYTMMSPYPGLDRPISLQSWGYQLKLDDPNDGRIDQFINALRQNQQTTPEPNAPCDPVTGGEFDPANPPPFESSPPGSDAVPDDAEPSAGPTPTG
jgi:hypothetical protein